MADETTNRRGALRTLVVAGGVGCGALAVPTARFLAAPVKGAAGAGVWIRTVRLESLGEGVAKRVSLVADRRDAWTLDKQVELGAAWLVRRGDRVEAWSATCPHLGCSIDAEEGGGGFDCPCHDSSFAGDGKRLDGPSPRDMDPLDARVEDGVVVVAFRRFRQGTPERIPV